MGKFIIKNQVNIEYSNNSLKSLIKEDFNGLHLTPTEKQVLKKIGKEGKVKSSDYKEYIPFGISNMQQFISNYLTKLHDQQLLFRRQEGKSITYELRGISIFSLEYGLFD
jgi:hypothetical protein